ncbi:hypothetical protein [uncultured Shimia sp.]|uniref:hypothetical protein n=1 Tax=uncultured Shimia sp. TaxID=573152 RepID=UPI0025E049EB|nr:hypothetical protein [uncultured Shimia sp.]
MKIYALPFLVLLAATQLSARELIGEARVDDQPVLIYDDGFWRFDDAGGEICTDAGKHGKVCALPSHWSRLPQLDMTNGARPTFIHDQIQAEFSVLQHWGNEDLTLADMTAFIRSKTTYSGLNATLLSSTESSIGEFQGGHVVVQAGAQGVLAFTFAFQNGRFLIAQTREQNTTLYHSGHKRAHQSFVDALRPAAFERP